MTRDDVVYDTEFLDDGERLMLISIGMVGSDGRELYAVNADMDQYAVRTHPWLSHHVWPLLPLTTPEPGFRGGTHLRLDTDHPDVRPKKQIARLVLDFLRSYNEPELHACYSAHDHVVLTWLWGPLVKAPRGVPHDTNCLRQEAKRQGNPPLPYQKQGQHHALEDARHARKIHHILRASSTK